MPAAGSGSRLGGDHPKALMPLAGQPLFVHALTPFVTHQDCVEIVIAAPAEAEARFRDPCQKNFRHERIRIVTGGATRQHSVHSALKTVSAACTAVLIHDAARPFVSNIIIQRVLDCLRAGATAALPGLRVVDTLKFATGIPPKVHQTVPRDSLFAVQTPQGLLRIPALDAFDRAAAENYQATDDVALIEKYGLGDVVICEGDAKNFKVTTQSDLQRARDHLERA